MSLSSWICAYRDIFLTMGRILFYSFAIWAILATPFDYMPHSDIDEVAEFVAICAVFELLITYPRCTLGRGLFYVIVVICMGLAGLYMSTQTAKVSDKSIESRCQPCSHK